MADLQGRALDAAVAERVMGLKIINVNCLANFYLSWTRYGYIGASIMHPLEKGPHIDLGDRSAGMPHVKIIPAYSSDHNVVALVRAEIERRGLVEDYIMYLICAVFPIEKGPYPNDLTSAQLFTFANATPDQQCRAALKAVEEAHA